MQSKYERAVESNIISNSNIHLHSLSSSNISPTLSHLHLHSHFQISHCHVNHHHGLSHLRQPLSSIITAMSEPPPRPLAGAGVEPFAPPLSPIFVVFVISCGFCWGVRRVKLRPTKPSLPSVRFLPFSSLNLSHHKNLFIYAQKTNPLSFSLPLHYLHSHQHLNFVHYSNKNFGCIPVGLSFLWEKDDWFFFCGGLFLFFIFLSLCYV